MHEITEGAVPRSVEHSGFACDSAHAERNLKWHWWPHTRTGSVIKIVLLVSTFTAATKDGEPGAYTVLSAFFLLTALRYGWWRLSPNASAQKDGAWWQTPGAVCFGCWLLLLVYNTSGPAIGDGSKLHKQVAASIEANRQGWFGEFHPIGEAKAVKLHSLDVSDGREGKRLTARFTIYWEGPLTKDGFTKIRAVYDEESGRWTRAEILDTNGTTNTQAAEGIGGFIGGLLAE